MSDERCRFVSTSVAGESVGPALLMGNLCACASGLVAFAEPMRLCWFHVDVKRGTARAKCAQKIAGVMEIQSVQLEGVDCVVTATTSGCSVWSAASDRPLCTVAMDELEGGAPDGSTFARGITSLVVSGARYYFARRQRCDTSVCRYFARYDSGAARGGQCERATLLTCAVRAASAAAGG